MTENEAECLSEASKIAKDYIELYIRGDWRGVEEANDAIDDWEIEIKIERENAVKYPEIVVKKENGNIKSIDI